MPRKSNPVMAYANDAQKEMLAKLSEVLGKSQSQVLLMLVEEKYKELFRP
jgi:hypothetical protein